MSDRVIGLPDICSAEHAARPALLGRSTYSYGELETAVHAVAHRLRELDATIGDRVVIWMDKRPEYVQVMLGALHAGCAYVAVDGAHPASRLSTIVADTEPILLVIDERRLPDVAEMTLPQSIRTVAVVGQADGGGATVPTVGWTDFLANTETVRVPRAEITPSSLAAILYTSGSTGKPKGVQISHRNLAVFVEWACAELAVGSGDVFANHASFNFDLSTFDVFVALSVGAAVWIISDEQARDPVALADGIREHGVTVWYSVPSVLTLLTTSGSLTPDAVRSLRYVLFAGEVFPKPRLAELATLLHDRTVLYNLYGPTETNVCMYHRVTAQDLASEDPLPLGLPVGDARLLIVDEEVPAFDEVGVYSELVVEGDCVTPGYWRRELLAEEHRRHRHPTGDLVSCIDGQIIYRGRKDRMVKLSGYRAELGEIESVILRHCSIEEAAVIASGAGSTARLKVFYTLRAGALDLTLIGLKRHCAEHLPRYMVPAAATCVEALPRNANGKIDYRRLAG
ncbi:amino acid adenylation domain-containing protein [Nocardia suismassiliense]|uniref:amino acid adenylation domain-containing protein n=1 Tax=Nocardia suismassiliense TaxID=2077092 RepID=UPI000D1D9B7C|nr:amino acid adenylation domain-containing protein [Nocardia suismassiliense]